MSATQYREAADQRDALARANAEQAERIERLEAQEGNLADELASIHREAPTTRFVAGEKLVAELHRGGVDVYRVDLDAWV